MMNKNSNKNKKYIIKKSKKKSNKSKDQDSASIVKTINETPSKAHEIANSISISQLEKLIQYANNKYYSGQDVLNDDIYDSIREILEQRDPTNKMLDVIGADHTDTDQMEPLPYYMGSMDKIKPDSKALDKWKVKFGGPYNLSIKLDGVSGLLYIKNGNIKL